MKTTEVWFFCIHFLTMLLGKKIRPYLDLQVEDRGVSINLQGPGGDFLRHTPRLVKQ